MPSSQETAAGSCRPSVPPPCPALPSPGGWDQGASLESGRPRDLLGANCSHPSDRRGLRSVLGGGSRQKSGRSQEGTSAWEAPTQVQRSASRSLSSLPRGCCLRPFWKLRAVRAFGIFFFLTFFPLFFVFVFLSFFLENFISITAPAQTFTFLWVFLWIFPRTGEFGERNHGSVAASPNPPHILCS